MFKKPTGKNVKDTAPKVAAIVGGAMAGSGVQSLVPLENPTHKKIAVGVIGAALLLAYNGPQKAIVKNVGLGMVASKAMEAIQDVARANITPPDAPNAIERAGYSALGLMCACDEPYQMGMGSPGQSSIAEVVYADIYTPSNTTDISHSEVFTGV